MKIIKQLLFFTACIFVLSTCTNSDVIIDDSALSPSLKKGNDKEVFVTVPFKANFTGTYDFSSFIFNPGPDVCEDKYSVKVFVDFEGNATHLGKMNGRFEFCAGGPENPNVRTPNSTYAPSYSYMIAANGDILYVTISGQVITGREDDHPEHVTSYFRDEFEIIGGTGRFEGAYGGGMSDDYNSSLDPNSHHNWYGTITMKKGKRK